VRFDNKKPNSLDTLADDLGGKTKKSGVPRTCHWKSAHAVYHNAETTQRCFRKYFRLVVLNGPRTQFLIVLANFERYLSWL